MAADLLNERLPPDWSYGVTGDGRVFFISERQQETSWLHPVTGRPVQTGHQAAPGLPNGWEQDYTPEGVTYFIDHNNKQTSFGHPVTGRPVSEESPPPPPRSPPQSPLERPELRRGTTNAKQRSIKAPSAKRNPNAQVVRRGFLYRLESGGISRAWKRRWCVLADFALFIYKGDDERSALGSVLLPSYRISRCTAEDPVQKEFAFKVEHENTKTVYFHTDTQTDLNSWLSNLQMAATMKGNSGFYREPNNNVKRDPTGMAQQSPPYANQRSDYPDRLEPSPQDSSSNFHPQWKNPNPAPRQEDYRPSPPQNSLSEQPSWRSVPDLEEDGRGLRGEENGPRGSLQSLPREGVRGQIDPSLPRLHPEARNYPHYQSYDPRLVRRDMLEQDPRGSVRSLQPDPRKNVPEFVPLGHFKTTGGDRDSYSQPGFQPYRPPHPQQRSSMVSDPGRQEGQGSPQRSPREGNTGSLPGAYQPRYPSLGETRNEPFLPDHNRQASDGSARNRDSSSWRGSTAGPSEFQPQQRDSRSYPDPGRGYPDQYDGYPDPNRGHIDSRNSYPEQNRDRGYPEPQRGHPDQRNSLDRDRGYPEPQRGHPDQRNSLDRDRGYPESQRGYPDQRNSLDRDRGYPDQRNSYAPQEGSYSVRENQRSRMQDLSREGDRFDSNPRLNTSRDPRASYASSRHSLASQGYGGDRDRDNLGSKQNLFPPHGGSRSSLSRLPPNSSAQSAPSPHNAQHGHTYVNVPEMRGAAQVDSPPPERPPYPAEVRDQIVRDLADTRSPGTAETLLKAHEMNKERMQRSEFFQYPTPPRDSTVSRLDDSRGSDPVKRLSQYSNRSSMASNSAMRSNNNSSNVGNPPHPAAMREFPEGGRRQDSGSGRFSDSFERHSDERRTEDPGRLTRREQPGEMPPPDEQRFGGDPEAKTLRQAYERVQSFRQSSAAAREGMNRRPIQTVREEPDMPDNEVLETKLKKKYPLNGTRLRMSISAGDLIGKTHDELVLLLIQLRRNQAALEKARDFYRESLYKRRPAEREYRRQIHDSVGRLERSLEEGHQSFVDIRSQLEEVEKKLEVYRPLINLVDNMVTMGSLYGGDNLMLATQYRKHLLRPDQYQAPRKMLEFSRQHQEARVVSGIQNDVRQLTAAEVDLEEKIERLNQLERLLQEQSFKVSSFREDKELLEKALTDIQRQMREGQDGPREYRRLQQQQQSVEKELSRVTQELAEASKALEETTVENSKIEHEVALLRTKVHGELKRSKSAPSLATDSANTKVKMERELARVQNMLQGLSQQGEKLSQQMSTIRRSSSGTQLAAAFDEAEKSRKVGTYLQTDLDSGDQIDLAQQIPGQSPASTLTPASPLTPSVPFMAEDGAEVPLISHQRQETTYGINSSMSEGESRADWDIGDADDNTKRFYGLLPREKPRGLTVRDVKRQSEQRRERKRDEEGQEIPLRVSSTDDDTTTFIHARYPSYTSSQSSGLDLSARDPSAPLYENLPRSGSMPSLNGSAPSSRRSSISLLAPKPFTPYQDRSAKPFRSELVLNSTENPMDLSQGSGFASSKPFASDMALDSGWSESVGVENGQSLNREPQAAGDVGIVSARPLQLGRSADNIFDMQPGVSRSVALPTYTRVPQPFRREPFNLSQSTPHLNSEPSPLPSFTPSLPPSEAPSRPAFKSENTSSLYTPRPWGMERTDSQPGLYDVKKSPKGRYMTVSSSQPAKMEPGALLGSGVRSSAGDLISNARVDDVPDVVKSSLTNVDKIDQMNEDMIDREVLYFPEKVLIPERYDAEADAEHLTESQKRERQEKADRIKRLLTNQSVLSMSQPDVNHIPPAQLYNQLQREKQERAHILSLNQELARQVTQQTKKAAAARRKTWSGGQIADIKAQYEAEQAASQGQFDNLSRASRQANVLL